MSGTNSAVHTPAPAQAPAESYEGHIAQIDRRIPTPLAPLSPEPAASCGGQGTRTHWPVS